MGIMVLKPAKYAAFCYNNLQMKADIMSHTMTKELSNPFDVDLTELSFDELNDLSLLIHSLSVLVHTDNDIGIILNTDSSFPNMKFVSSLNGAYEILGQRIYREIKSRDLTEDQRIFLAEQVLGADDLFA